MIDLSVPEKVRLAAWAALVGAISVTSSVISVRWAEGDQIAPVDDATARHWLATWAIVTGVALVLVALLGGLVVFRSHTAWTLVVLARSRPD